MATSQSTTSTSNNPKPFIILIHGGASSSRMYNNVLAFLPSSEYTVITPELPGHGPQAAKTGPFTFESAAESITQCITLNAGPSQPISTSTTTRPKILLVGISLGGQAVLSFLQSKDKARLIDAAIVSGASINPPDEKTPWEIPHMPSDKETIDMMMEDVAFAGMENMPALQALSLGFTFRPDPDLGYRSDAAAAAAGETLEEQEGSRGFPPVLVMVGEHDTAMSRRDFEELLGICKGANGRSEGLVLKGAWHNHSIDVPELFAGVVKEWARKVL